MKPSVKYVACLALIVVGGFDARAQIVTNCCLPGIVCLSEVRTNPPEQLYVAEVDLTNPRLQLRVAPGGPDPDGPGPWQTTLMEPTKIAAREHFDLVINGDFFDARHTKDAEGTNSGYRAGMWASVVGVAMTDGKTWSSTASTNPRPSLIIHQDRRVTIETLSQPETDDWEVVSGNVMLVHDGLAVPSQNIVRHPRTVVGLDSTGAKLTILVVDGRKPGIAQGMSYGELSQEMLRLGCVEALNLDGGGSSILAVRDPATGRMRSLNVPTDGRERAVADVLGITIKP